MQVQHPGLLRQTPLTQNMASNHDMITDMAGL
jgi:hypothetical protein